MKCFNSASRASSEVLESVSFFQMVVNVRSLAFASPTLRFWFRVRRRSRPAADQKNAAEARFFPPYGVALTWRSPRMSNAAISFPAQQPFTGFYSRTSEQPSGALLLPATAQRTNRNLCKHCGKKKKYRRMYCSEAVVQQVLNCDLIQGLGEVLAREIRTTHTGMFCQVCCPNLKSDCFTSISINLFSAAA